MLEPLGEAHRAVWLFGAVALVWAGLALWMVLWMAPRLALPLAKGPRAGQPSAHHALLGAAFTAAAWGAVESAWAHEPSWALAAAAAGLDVLLTLGLCLFLLLITRDESVQQPLHRTRTGMIYLALALLCLGSGLNDVAQQALGHRALHSPPSGLSLLGRLTISVLAIVLLEQMWRQAPDGQRWALKPLWLGFALMAALEVYVASESLLFGRLSDQASALQAAGLLAVAPLVALGLRRNRGQALVLRLSHAAAYYSTSLLLVGGYLLLMAAAGSYVKYFGGVWGEALQALLMLLAVGVAAYVASSAGLRARLRVLVSKHFFRYRYDYREEWLRFTAQLSAGTDPREVGQRVLGGLEQLVQAHAGAIWVREADGVFRVLAQRGFHESAELVDDAPLVAFLQRTGWVVDLREFRDNPSPYDGLVLPSWLFAMRGARLVVPLVAGGEVAGLAVLGEPAAGLSVNWEVRDVLKTAAAQAAGYLVQMQATEALLDARKFEAFNRMSAFVVHDIKNIVTQLALMASNAQRLGHKPEFQADMIETVQLSVDKMRRLLVQLREGGAPASDAATGGVELEPLLRRLQKRAADRGRTVELRRSERLATRGDGPRLERVLGHLLDNALDATTPDQPVWLALWREAGSVCVEVGDAGPGMSENFVRHHLFRPFHTTKAGGMGIGMHESRQYLGEMGGRLDVDSRLGGGTRMTARMPALEIETRSALAEVG